MRPASSPDAPVTPNPSTCLLSRSTSACRHRSACLTRRRKRLRQVSLELRELITAEEAVVDLPRVNELLDELIAGGDAGLPFDEAAIGGGPWVVSCIGRDPE